MVVPADDHEIFRNGLKILIDSNVDNAEIVGEAHNGREAVSLTRLLKPDVVLMDVSMPELNGIAAATQIMLEKPDCVVIGLSMHQSNEYVTQMLGAGARGYIVKNAAFNELNEALQTVAQGSVYLNSEIAQNVVSDQSRATINTDHSEGTDLSPTEREILRLVAEGNTTATIADNLCINVSTVETHRSQILRKLHLNGVAAVTSSRVRSRGDGG